VSRIERNGRRRSLRRPKRSEIKESSAPGRRRRIWLVMPCRLAGAFVSVKFWVLTAVNVKGGVSVRYEA
jgi:hypothetical protein